MKSRQFFVCIIFLLLTCSLRPATQQVHGKVFAPNFLFFESNRGQTGDNAAFVGRATGYDVRLSKHEFVYALRTALARTKKGSQPLPSSQFRVEFESTTGPTSLAGEHPLTGRSNYLLGQDPRRWITQISTFDQVKYTNIYNGIDLVCHGTGGRFEYDFVVRPHGDPSVIRFRIVGSRGINLESSGDIVLEMPDGRVRMRKPTAYQRHATYPVATSYVLTAGNEVSLHVANYDPREELVIDPLLSYSSYLGGGADYASSIAVDASGQVYVAGQTSSAMFPVSPAAFQHNYNGLPTQSNNAGNAFVTKLSSDGSSLIYSTYIGGTDQGAPDSGGDVANAIAIDSHGNAFITGTTSSSDFPTTPNAFQPRFSCCATISERDGFVAELSEDGSSLVFSTYLGGGDGGSGNGIAVGVSGNVYVAGTTASTDFPTTANAIQQSDPTGPVCGTFSPCSHAYVAEFDRTGTSLLYGTYIGGTQVDFGNAIALDQAESIYLTGQTTSTDFPLTASAFQRTNNSAGSCNQAFCSNAFVAKLSVIAAQPMYSTYLGGSINDSAVAIAVDGGGNAFITGSTNSPDFPTTAGGVQPRCKTDSSGSCRDAFIAKLDPQGHGLVYSTFLGGSNNDSGAAVAVDTSGGAYVTGLTSSVDFPITSDAIQKAVAGGGANPCGAPCPDAFVAVLNSSGSKLRFSTYLGGSFVDYGSAIATDGSAAYIAGLTSSADFPPTSGALQTQYTGTSATSNAFVTKLSLSPPGFTISALPQAETVQPGRTATYQIQVASQGGFSGSVRLSCTQGLPPGATCGFTPAAISPAGPKSSQLIIATKGTTTSLTDSPSRPWREDGFALSAALSLGAFPIGFLFIRLRRSHMIVAAVGILVLGACGGGKRQTVSAGTPTGTYLVKVAGVSGSLNSTTTVQLFVQ